MRILYGVLVALTLCLPGFVNAAVVINEVMYDVGGTDTGREWVEVWNDSIESIDLSTWKFFEANVGHKIVAIGSPVIPAGGYAVVSDSSEKFMADNPNFSGLLFDSAFSLGNAGETVSLKDSTDITTDTITYDISLGAAGDGNSLQRKTDGGWIAASPTPGSVTVALQSSVAVEQSESQSDVTNEIQNSASYSAHSSQSVATVSYEEPELVVTLGRSRLGFVGVPLSFEAKIKSVKNMPVTARLMYAWSMGDGTKENGQFISHVYEFPGEYIVLLNTSAGGVNAVSKVLVKIVSPRILVRAEPEYLTIQNLDSHELNLGGFTIETGGSKFIVPVDTLIAPKGVLRISLSTMRLNYGDKVNIKNPLGNMVERIDAPFLPVTTDTVLISLPPGVNVDTIREKLMMSQI